MHNLLPFALDFKRPTGDIVLPEAPQSELERHG
jgi:hypothetical protein